MTRSEAYMMETNRFNLSLVSILFRLLIIIFKIFLEAATWRGSVKTVLLKIVQN